MKQAGEFGLRQKGQSLIGLLVYISDVHSIGLELAQGLVLGSAFYWDANEESRAFAKRFFAQRNAMPTMIQAGVYSAVTHYLNAVRVAGTDEGSAAAAKMRELPINDFMTRNGRAREDGRVIRDMYLFEVKRPSESKGPWDYYRQLAAIPADEAFRSLSEGECPLVRR